MKNRKRNRMKGFDYSSNNLYFVTNCVKDNVCCLGRVIIVGTGRVGTVRVGTGRDLSVQDSQNQDSQNQDFEINHVVELNQFGLLVEERINWLMSQYAYVDIHNYVIMPNHFHLILEIDSQKVKDKEIKIKSLSSLMGALKTTTSKLIHEAGFQEFEWHRSFHDHIIRNEFSYLNIFNYISNNPERWDDDVFFKKV
ncbi:transposase [Flavobacterium sp. UBA6135]|uniref:transposase n=1 Tax=Flavobacterium sp. UBA6135 TaxID=1946553 RepID=UPI0025BD06FA|nr:transposase [Flavobacterium sp. UBA6135]